jgi:uncharacterized membrane protein YciS (DUF1049 family)
MLKTILIIFLFIFAIVFIFQNQQIFLHTFSVNYDMRVFEVSSIEINNSILMISAFVLGSLISLILIGASLFKKSLKNTELKKKIIALETTDSRKVKEQ